MSGVVGPRYNDSDPRDEEDAWRDHEREAAGVDPFDEPDPSWDEPDEFEGDDDGA
jgi:hypothetical protein